LSCAVITIFSIKNAPGTPNTIPIMTNMIILLSHHMPLLVGLLLETLDFFEFQPFGRVIFSNIVRTVLSNMF
jgi:hypothetical protein